MGNIHIEFWQFIVGMIAYTGAVVGVAVRMTSFVSRTDYERHHGELENRVYDMEIRMARLDGQIARGSL